MNDLVEVEVTEEYAVGILTGKGMDDFLEEVRGNALSFQANPETESGRKMIRSGAHTIASRILLLLIPSNVFHSPGNG